MVQNLILVTEGLSLIQDLQKFFNIGFVMKFGIPHRCNPLDNSVQFPHLQTVENVSQVLKKNPTKREKG